MSPEPLVRATGTLKALAHPTRLRVLAMLRSGGLCVCQVAATLGSPVSTVSEHLGELRRAGLVVERKNGRWVSYRLADEAEGQALLGQVWARIAQDPQVEADARLVRRLRRISVEELCRGDLDVTRFGLKRQTGRKQEADRTSSKSEAHVSLSKARRR